MRAAASSTRWILPTARTLLRQASRGFATQTRVLLAPENARAEDPARRKLPEDVPSLGDFMQAGHKKGIEDLGGREQLEGEVPVGVPGIVQPDTAIDHLNFFVETYGCGP